MWRYESEARSLGGIITELPLSKKRMRLIFTHVLTPLCKILPRLELVKELYREDRGILDHMGVIRRLG